MPRRRHGIVCRCKLNDRASVAFAAKFRQRDALDLPHALLRQPQPRSQLVVRRRRRFAEPEMPADDVALAAVEALEQLRDFLARQNRSAAAVARRSGISNVNSSLCCPRPRDWTASICGTLRANPFIRASVA